MRIDSIDYKFMDINNDVEGFLNVRLTSSEVTKLHTDFHTSTTGTGEFVIMPKDEFRMRTMINNSYYGIYGTGMLRIKEVIFNEPATIVLWADGTKTVVKCEEGDTFDKEKGIALCFMKKINGNKGKYNNIFKKFIKEDEE